MRFSQRTARAWPAVVTLAYGVAVYATSPASALAIPQEPSASAAFGFVVGEERRYALGPPGALDIGESDLWTMRLESINGEGRELRARFHLLHESRRFPRQANLFTPTKLIVERVAMDVTVNEHGFPLHVAYLRTLENSPAPHTREEVTVRFEEDAFRVSNPMSMGYRRFDIGLPTSSLADPAVPYGVYISAGENPGLYSLILAGVPIEEEGDYEYLALQPGRLASRDTWRYRRPTETDNLPNLRLRFAEHTTVDIGGVAEEALRLRRSSGGHPDIYVRPDGTVLRVDTPTRRRTSAYIRLLRPSEY